ncbi:hypothetical protein F4680DRAFT_453799 [Xylaria scruposa]|nr:hypothetical protein F4680DRAFT_453799 [Xylaria scruposa]
MAPTEFLFYPRLPNELKVMIWEYAFAEWSSGAHRFRLFINPQSPTKLVMRPDNDQKDDASAWRERLALAKIDSCSKYVFIKLQRKAKQRNQLKLLYKDTSYSRRRRVEENGVAANICADTDLVTFRFNYGVTEASLALLSHVENKEVFTGITQVGIEVDFLLKGCVRNSKYKPFRFHCRHPYGHHPPGACQTGVVNFLRWFKDLKTVYLIFALRCGGQDALSNYLRLTHTAALSRLRTNGRNVNQPTLDAFKAIQGFAQQRGLKQFHNRDGTYCEMNYIGILWEYIEYFYMLRLEWGMFHVIQNSNFDYNSVQFKLLSWTDLRGVTVIGDEQPLRRSKPQK